MKTTLISALLLMAMFGCTKPAVQAPTPTHSMKIEQLQHLNFTLNGTVVIDSTKSVYSFSGRSGDVISLSFDSSIEGNTSWVFDNGAVSIFQSNKNLTYAIK